MYILHIILTVYNSRFTGRRTIVFINGTQINVNNNNNNNNNNDNNNNDNNNNNNNNFLKCSEQLYDGKLGTAAASDIIHVKPFICVVEK